MARPALEVADIFRHHGAAWRDANRGRVSLDQLKVMSAIESCRTAALGGHVARCEDCAHTVIAYNSCRHRHCPKCQGAAARAWMAARETELLPASSKSGRTNNPTAPKYPLSKLCSRARFESSNLGLIIFSTSMTDTLPRPPCCKNSALLTAPWWLITYAVFLSSLRTIFAGSPIGVPSRRSGRTLDRLTMAFGVLLFRGFSAALKSIA